MRERPHDAVTNSSLDTMRCSTCGETLRVGEERCPTCGAAVGSGGRSLPSAFGSVKRCPRCGYNGQGVSYFSRPGHVGLLVGVSLFTYGLGGMVYWLARRKHDICPNCGYSWEHAGRVLTSGEPEAPSTDASDWERDQALPSAGMKRRVFGTVLVLFASFLIMMGIIELEAAAIAVGSVVGAAGSGAFFWGWKSLQERRQALMTGLQRRVLRLATRKGGTLTVTEVASDLNLSIPVAEKVLIGMDDGFRVRSDITKEGILLYEFPEVKHRGRLGTGGEAAI